MNLVDLRIAQPPHLSFAVPELADPVILPAVAEVGREAASNSGGDAFGVQERTHHQRKVAARADGSPSRQNAGACSGRESLFENIGKAVRDRQRLARIGAKLPLVNGIGAEPIRVDQQALNNAIESADAGRQRRHRSPHVSPDRTFGCALAHRSTPIILKKLRCIQRRKPNGDGARRLPHSGAHCGTPICPRRLDVHYARVLATECADVSSAPCRHSGLDLDRSDPGERASWRSNSRMSFPPTPRPS